MPVTFDRSETPGVIRLEGAIDIGCAAELKQALLEALASKGTARISFESATGMDVTAVQLLWAAARHAKSAGVGFAIESQVPETVSAVLAQAGLGSLPISQDMA